MNFIITINDPAHLAGLTWAREQRNASLAKDEDGNTIGELVTDQDYLQWLIADNAAPDYAKQRAAAGVTDAIKAADEGDLTKLDAVRAEYEAKEGSPALALKG